MWEWTRKDWKIECIDCTIMQDKTAVTCSFLSVAESAHWQLRSSSVAPHSWSSVSNSARNSTENLPLRCFHHRLSRGDYGAFLNVEGGGGGLWSEQDVA